MGEENMDYKTIVVSLREHAKHDGDCYICPCYDAEDRGYEMCSEELAVKAADAIEELIAALTASNEVIARSKPQWISVMERLPKTFDDVIVCRSGTRVMPGRLDNNGWWKVFGTRTKDVSHWMPLPEPPKEDEQKNCYNCFWGGDGEEINDYGHCWKPNGEADYEQPNKKTGCGEWKPK